MRTVKHSRVHWSYTVKVLFFGTVRIQFLSWTRLLCCLIYRKFIITINTTNFIIYTYIYIYIVGRVAQSV